MLWGMAQLWVRVEAEAWPFVVIVGCKWHRGDIVAGAGGHAGQGECVHAQGGTLCDLDDDIGTIRTGRIGGGTMEELDAFSSSSGSSSGAGGRDFRLDFGMAERASPVHSPEAFRNPPS